MADKAVRPSMSKLRRARIFAAHEGKCELCGEKINGPYEIEHRIAWWISKDDSDGNLYPCHVECHKPKTKTDKGKIAKVKRLIAKADPETRKSPKMKSAGFRPKPPGFKTKWPKRKFGA
jgi:5-methylcytosine-specific restriction endonuclease McrA